MSDIFISYSRHDKEIVLPFVKSIEQKFGAVCWIDLEGIEYGSQFEDVIVDAISELNLEDESKIFIVIPNAWKAALRKDEDYKSARQGEVIYNGQVGAIAGIPVIATKALTDKAYVMTNEAVTLFIKKDVEVEQDRDVDKRKNSIYLRDCYVCALTDATKACKISEAAQ